MSAERDPVEEQQALHEEARRTAALLDALYGSAPVGLGFWDRDLRFVRVNDTLAAINELAPEAHIGKTFAEVAPQVAHIVEPVARQVLERREPVALEHTSGTPGHPDEVRHWLASYYPVLAPDGEVIGVGSVVEEITDRRRAEQRTELQHSVTGILGDAETVEDAVPRVLAAIVETLGWDVACFWSTQPDAPRLVSVRPGLQLDGFLAMTERLTLSPAMLPGRVVLSGAPEWLDELAPDRFRRASVAAAEGLRSGVAFPVPIESEVVGALEVFSTARRPHDPELERTLGAIGTQLGQFVRRRRAEEERAQLLQRERQARANAEAAAATLRKLGRVSEAALAHLSLSDLLNALLERIVEVLQADSAAILLVGADEHLHVRATVGLEQEIASAVPVPLGAGLAGRVAATRVPMLVPDLSGIELVSPVLRDRGINSLVAIPLIVEDRVIGVVHAGSEAFAQFVEEDAHLLELIADRIALAIHQASLHEAERAAQQRLQLLAEASALLGASLDIDRTLARLSGLVAGRLADWCAIHVVSEAGEPRLVSDAHADPGVDVVPPDAPLCIGEVIRTGAPEVQREPPAELVEAGLRSCLTVPLQARGRVFGALTLAWSEPRFDHDERDLEFALDLAGRAAVAVDNAQLYRAAEERAQAARVLASVGDGVFLVDRHGDVRTWNRAAAAATGLQEADVVDRAAVEAIPGWGAIAARIPIVAAGSGPPRAESLPLDLGDRELWLSLHGVVVPDGIVYAFRDLTEERALETMRTEFVSTVSHELRTPLAAIYGAAMTLRRSDVVLDDAQRAILLDVVSGEADRLARTVNDILWASRLDADSLHMTIQACDPVTLVEDIVRAQRAHLDRGHELVLTVEPGLPEVSGDPDKVGRILINLVDNGVKYSPDGGRVELRVRAVGSQVRFSVADEGIGIPPSEQRRIFEKFYRLDPNMTRGVGGTGLGLYICRELVRRMDGRIWVESQGLGRGSSFHVELPVAPPY